MFDDSQTLLQKFRRSLLYVFLSFIAVITLFPFALMILTSLREGGGPDPDFESYS